MKFIEVIVSSTGETKIETKGFHGTECQQASQFIEQALGSKLSDQPTSELHLSQPQQLQLRQDSV